MTTPDYSFPNITPWTNSQVRNGPFPLDRYSVFSSLADAEEYAAGVLAYEGQQIAVAGAGGVSAFMLDSKAESGMRMLPDISAAAAELSNCGYLTSVPAAGDDTLGGVKLGYETDAANKNYALTVDADTGKAYVSVPWESGGGGGGTTVEVDGVTIKKNTSNQIYVAGVPLSVRSAISATSSNFGTIKLGYLQNERNYPLQLSTDGKAYVSVPWTDTPTPASAISADLTSVFQAKGSYLTAVPAATDAAIGGIKTGYSGSGKNYPLSLDADSKAFVHVPWESGSNVDVDNDTLSTNASGKLYVRQILSSQVSGLGSFATKSSLLSTDIPALNSTKISDLGDLATKDESELDFASKATTLAGYGITDAKIENSVSITLGDTTISVLTAHQQVSDISAGMAAALRVPLTGYAEPTFETYPMQIDENGKAFVSVDVSYRPRACEVSLAGSTNVEISVYNRSLHYVELANTSPQQNLLIYPIPDPAIAQPFDAVLVLKPAFPLTAVHILNSHNELARMITPDPEATTRTIPNGVPTCISLTKLDPANAYIFNRSLMYELDS